MVSNFPHLTQPEFDQACTNFSTLFARHVDIPSPWSSVDILTTFNTTKFLRITKPLAPPQTQITPSEETRLSSPDHTPILEDDNDDEALRPPTTAPSPHAASIQYDVLLSPTYSVPVLYISVKDALFRYPPTLSTLYDVIIPPAYAAQTRDVGVVGGISMTDHPVSNSPVFFIHPCRTAEVMLASFASGQVGIDEYLITWIGAMGRCVGLDVPLSFFMALQRETSSGQSFCRDHGNKCIGKANRVVETIDSEDQYQNDH